MIKLKESVHAKVTSKRGRIPLLNLKNSQNEVLCIPSRNSVVWKTWTLSKGKPRTSKTGRKKRSLDWMQSRSLYFVWRESTWQIFPAWKRIEKAPEKAPQLKKPTFHKSVAIYQRIAVSFSGRNWSKIKLMKAT
jgi:hypothetical protein